MPVLDRKCGDLSMRNLPGCSRSHNVTAGRAVWRIDAYWPPLPWLRPHLDPEPRGKPGRFVAGATRTLAISKSRHSVGTVDAPGQKTERGMLHLERRLPLCGHASDRNAMNMFFLVVRAIQGRRNDSCKALKSRANAQAAFGQRNGRREFGRKAPCKGPNSL